VVLAAGHDAVCLFVNDLCNSEVLQKLSELGVVSTLLERASYLPVKLMEYCRNMLPCDAQDTIMLIFMQLQILASRSFESLLTRQKLSQSLPLE